ncbi:CDP-glycerol glycerophosphotransferase family protein [Paenibacillus sp. 32352]|uniref:CDP-glycerol glycerophosphotransferase family protein n=1 Tax=Paenibacillus sp. 32352 TaxID=1969111 RepID=UPI0009ADEC62|nr:CDP-glycerol glycerophosphotransferase family protein [Paenibacillus sp. 32352]
MHYRFYKLAIQDCHAMISMLENEQLTMTKRLWINGILQDLYCRITQDESMECSTRNVLTYHLENICFNIKIISPDLLIVSLQRLLLIIETKLLVRIRIDMLFARPVSASYLLAVYHQLRNLACVEVRIIAVDFYPTDIYKSNGQIEQLVELLDNAGVEYIPFQEYNVFHDLPDLILYSFLGQASIKPLNLQHSTISSIINRTMFLEYSLIPVDLMLLDSSYTLTPYTWLQFRSSNFSYNSISWGKQDIVTGHPLMDMSYDMYSGDSKIPVPEEWLPLLSGKTTILWNISPVFNSDTINFVDTKSKIHNMLKIVSEISKRYSNILIMLRPHPLCFLPEFQELFADLNERIIVDRNSDSFPALYIADAYIGDYGSLYMQFLPSKRPALICNVPSNDCSFIFWSQTNLLSKMEDIYEFVEKLITDYSSMLRPVTEIDRYCLGPMDGKNSQRIVNSMVTKFFAEEDIFINKYCINIANEISEMEPLS